MLFSTLAYDSQSPAAKAGRILIVKSENCSVELLRAHLSAAAYDVEIVSIPEPNAATPQCLVSAETQFPVECPDLTIFYAPDMASSYPQILADLKQHFGVFDINSLGIVPSADTQFVDLFTSFIALPAHPVQIVTHIQALKRIHRMENEIATRLETLREDFGYDYVLDETVLQKPMRILFLGRATPEFLVVVNAFEDQNIDIIAAFTSYSAFDFLHTSDFDGVIINPDNNIEQSISVIKTMRRNSRLFHTPVIILQTKPIEDMQKIFDIGVTDIIPYQANPAELRGRVLEASKFHKLHRDLRHEFGQIGGHFCHDIPSGVFNRAFIEAHFQRTLHACHSTGAHSALMLLKLSPDASDIDPVALNIAYNQAGQILRKMLRMEDVIGRISPNVYAIIFPGDSTKNVQPAHDRVVQVLTHHAFSSSLDDKITFKLELDTVMHDVAPTDSATSALNTAISELDRRYIDVDIFFDTQFPNLDKDPKDTSSAV